MAALPGPVQPAGLDSLAARFAALEVETPALQVYLFGLADAARGDPALARRRADRLEAMPPDPGLPPDLNSDLAHGLRADAMFREGRLEEALAELDRAEWRLGTFEGLPFGLRENFLRARILDELGQDQEALDAYTASVSEMAVGVAYLAPLHYYRGLIHEEMGNADQARQHYGALLALWRDADPEYQPVVQEVRRRMTELPGS
jgi:tetratricopeptide (TPR) repeat protein